MHFVHPAPIQNLDEQFHSSNYGPNGHLLNQPIFKEILNFPSFVYFNNFPYREEAMF